MFNAFRMFAGRNTDVAMMCAHDLYQGIAIKLKPRHEGSYAVEQIAQGGCAASILGVKTRLDKTQSNLV